MKTTKIQAAAARKQQRDTKRTGFGKAKRTQSRKAAGAIGETAPPRDDSKLATIIKLLKRSEGATLAQMTNATGWQTHSVRGAMSGALGKMRGLTITSVKTDGVRVYRITERAGG
jgi:hypothetical protein